ncbi:DUF5789 family protein [Halobacterium zhouii]|uniref:DUF5789 family protein n=1 Tax=Halobacterium zhouii TaxID=2902624 RepID=UPI001E38F9D6|nr:hypothetical protein [Halobacterium zhouii]
MPKSVTIEELEEQLQGESYPVSREYLLAEYGDYSIDVAGGEESVATVLERVEDDYFHDATTVLTDIRAGVDV